MLTERKLDEMVISAQVRINEKVEIMKTNYKEREGLKLNKQVPPPQPVMGGE